MLLRLQADPYETNLGSRADRCGAQVGVVKELLQPPLAQVVGPPGEFTNPNAGGASKEWAGGCCHDRL